MTASSNWVRDERDPGTYWSTTSAMRLRVRLEGQKWILTVYGRGRQVVLTEAFDRRLNAMGRGEQIALEDLLRDRLAAEYESLPREPEQIDPHDPAGRPYREAAGIILQSPDGRSILVGLRAEWLEFGGTWSIPGGLLDPGETPIVGAVRETCEELGIDVWTFADAVRNLRVLGRAWKPGRGGYYTTFIAECDLRLDEIDLDHETLDVAWIPRRVLADLELHPGFAQTLGVPAAGAEAAR